MTDAYLGEVRLMSFGFPPKGWKLCNGDLLPIDQNRALYDLLGTKYGGDARLFALPDLRDRVPIHAGNGYGLGDKGGAQEHTLSESEMPTHTHSVLATSAYGDLALPNGHRLAAGVEAFKATWRYRDPTSTSLTSLHPETIRNVGGVEPHPNMQPYLALNFCIAVQGLPRGQRMDPWPYLGEIKISASVLAPPWGWQFCEGQLLSISANEALFNLIGYTYGGVPGGETFALPDLRCRVPVHFGGQFALAHYNGSELTDVKLTDVKLTTSQLPKHNHQFNASTESANQYSPGENLLAPGHHDPANPDDIVKLYYEDAPADTQLAPDSIKSSGGDQPHSNLQPYLAVRFMIATAGLFPVAS